MTAVYLREHDADTANACWVVCAEGDPGAVEFAPRTPTAEDLLSGLKLADERDNSRLLVMAQNPASHFHWNKSVGAFTAGEVRAALAARASK